MNKKGSMELSTNAIVIIVIASVILLLILVLIGKIFGEHLCVMDWCPFKKN